MPRLHPSPFLPSETEPTDEHRAEALRLTEHAVKSILVLLRTQDLPIASFDTVAEMYTQSLTGVLFRAETKRSEDRQKKIMTIAKLSQSHARAGIFPGHLGAPGGGNAFPAGDLYQALSGVEGMDDAELDAEIARLEALKRS